MAPNLAASDWAAARGEKWRSQLSGMEAMLTPLDEPLIQALELDVPCRIAEIGSGGGGTALEIERRAPRGSVVHGFDISPALVETARGQARAAERAVAFEVADMAKATPSRPYDRLVSRFGVMFFDEPVDAFANLVRWLAPGGRFAFAVWGPLSDNPWMTTVRDEVADVVEIPSLGPDAPGPFRYAEVGPFLALLRRVGFGEVASRDWRGALSLGGRLPAAEAARFALAAFSSFGELLAKAGEDAHSRALQSLTARLSPYQKDDAVLMSACVHVITGTRPR